jgi:hypothetical protein
MKIYHFLKNKIPIVLFWILIISGANAQNVKVTGANPACMYCLPDGWIKDGTLFPSISNHDYVGGDATVPWSPAVQAQVPSGLATFLTSYNSPTATTASHSTISGLDIGKTYYLRYNVMSSKSSTSAGYGATATVQLSNGAIASKSTIFTQGVNTNIWLEKYLVFTPTASSVRLTFSGTSTTGGYVNLDIGFNSISECLAGTNQVVIGSNKTIYSRCPGTPAIADLKTVVTSNTPGAAELVWFTNPTHSGVKYSFSNAAAVGTYYAFYYDKLRDCYNTSNSNAKVEVEPQITSVTTSNLSNGCSSSTVNLTAVLNPPFISNGVEVRWFANNSHSGSWLADPSEVSNSGDYYPFLYSTINGCYNDDSGDTKVTVSISQCPLNLTVFLQGAVKLNQQVMRNDLQSYFGGMQGLLPTTDPYNNGASYGAIGNANGPAGAVVDWIKVEIRSDVDPSIVHETRSLLLKIDGTVVDVDGAIPKFTPRPGKVRVAVKHRNHLAIMSNGITPNSNFILCNFSTSLAQASNAFSDPAQMVLKNGKWCMWSGDINAESDMSMDGADGTIFNTKFKQSTFDQYEKSDLNLDGVVDGVDGVLFGNNFKKGLSSTLINY